MSKRRKWATVVLIVAISALARVSSQDGIENSPGPRASVSDVSSSSANYDFDGGFTLGGGRSSSSTYEADLTLPGGASGTSSSTSYRLDVFAGASLIGSLYRSADNDRFELDWTDYDNNGIVNILDVAQAAFVFDRPDSYWDLNLNNRTDIIDIALIAFLFDHTLGQPPYPGYGQPPGTMDPNWKTLCTFFLEPHRTYCQTHI